MPHGHPIGVDVGLEKFLATSDGVLVKPPKFFKTMQSKLKLLRQKAVWIFLPLYCRATQII
jgi:putative transposase